MKKGYIKILIFQIVLFVILILNSFVSDILSEYKFILFLLGALGIFKLFFGFEKDRNRYTKDIIFEMVIILLVYFILIYLLGVVIDFAKISDYYNWYGLKTYIIPLIITIILKEILRYMMLKKSEGCKLLFITTIVLFIFVDISEAIYYNGFKTGYDTFIFIALSLLPAISSNIVFNYLAVQSGYKPIIFYLLITRLYVYLIPIIPDLNEYLTAIINFILPIIMGYKLYNFFQKENDKDIDREYNKKRIGVWVLPGILTLIIVYFTSGYFHYYALAIATGSMEPKISRGDIVIVEKIEDRIAELEVGRVIAYNYNEVVVVHRINKIVEEDNERFFYTKGDANNHVDNYVIKEDMIIGTVDFAVPYAGFPTVWINQ